MTEPTDPFATTDYRRFLSDALEARGLTRRELARAIDRSESWLSSMFSSLRSLDPALVEPIARWLALDAAMTAHFAALVDLENQSPRARQAALATLQAKHQHRSSVGLSEETAIACSRWYVGAINELATCEGFEADPEWIARTLVPSITRAEAQEALDILTRLGSLKPDGQGKLRRTEVFWSPSDLPTGQTSEAIAALHRGHLGLAEGGMEHARQNERHYSTIVLAMTEVDYPRFLTRLRELESELMVIANGLSTTPNRVYHLGIQLFPVSLYTDTEPSDEGTPAS